MQLKQMRQRVIQGECSKTLSNRQRLQDEIHLPVLHVCVVWHCSASGLRAIQAALTCLLFLFSSLPLAVPSLTNASLALPLS